MVVMKGPNGSCKYYTQNELKRLENYTRNEWKDGKTTLEASGKDGNFKL
jgi:hypothetical protein